MKIAAGSTMVWKASAFSGLLLFIAILYIGLWRDPSFIPSAQIGQPAKAFTLERLNGGGLIELDAYRGKWVILNFWASWCGACRQEHGLLVETGKRFSGDKSIQLIGVNFRDSEPGARRFLERLGTFPYPSGLDPRGRVGIDFGVYGLPETFLVSPQGKITSRHVGALTRDAIREMLGPALAHTTVGGSFQ